MNSFESVSIQKEGHGLYILPYPIPIVEPIVSDHFQRRFNYVLTRFIVRYRMIFPKSFFFLVHSASGTLCSEQSSA
jgi:hypothetical protein